MPLSSYGVDVDIVTGMPKDPRLSEAEQKDKERLYQHIDEGNQLDQELRSVAGQRFLQLVEEELVERLTQLMMRDEVCLSWISLLRKLDSKVELLPKEAVRRLNMLKNYRAALDEGYQP